MPQTTFEPGSDFPLGAHWDGSGVNFALFSAHATKVELCLFDRSGRREISRLALPEHTHEVWHGRFPRIRPGQLYGYRVHGPYAPEAGHRFNPNKLVLDPYALAHAGPLRWHDALFGYRVGASRGDLSFDRRDSAFVMPKCVVVDPAYTWGDDRRPSNSWASTVIYEAHVKGMTARHPDLPPPLRGTFEGLAEPRVIDHLVRLGVTAIELLPVQAFYDDRNLVDKGLKNYWGYNTLGFFAPAPRYLTERGDIHEFKLMVRRLHEAGIEVLMDVVYNHTAEGNQMGPTLSFRGIDNASYYVLGDDPRYTFDTTGTGNSLNLKNGRVLQMVMDSLRYWVEECHVDGFRFDLASTLGRDRDAFDSDSVFLEATRQDPVLSHVKLIAEPWDTGPNGYQLGHYPPGWAEWNDKYRDVTRAFWKGEPGQARELADNLLGSSRLFERRGRRPWASVNFVTAHDGFTLADTVSYEGKHNEANGEDNQDGHSPQPQPQLGRRGADRRSRDPRPARAHDAQHADHAARQPGHADDADGRRGRAHARGQQQRLLPGRGNELAVLGARARRGGPARLRGDADGDPAHPAAAGMAALPALGTQRARGRLRPLDARGGRRDERAGVGRPRHPRAGADARGARGRRADAAERLGRRGRLRAAPPGRRPLGRARGHRPGHGVAAPRGPRGRCPSGARPSFHDSAGEPFLVSTRRFDTSWGAVPQGDAVRFRLWAPGLDSLTLRLEEREIPMRTTGDGWFEAREPATSGTPYGFILPGGEFVPDPAARAQASDVHGPSLVVDPAEHVWSVESPARPWAEAVIYELHVGTFTEAGTFRAAAERMPHLAALGITAVELMPVADFEGERGWGYDGVLLYAPHRAYGTPGDMKAFVEAAHAAGLMVLLDVVYNHFGPEGNYINIFAPDFYGHGRSTPWGGAIDFTEAEVRRFYDENALYWLLEYDLDGLRLDAIDHIHDPSDPEILIEIARRVREARGDRPTWLTTEDNRNVTHLHERGPDGSTPLYDGEWNDDLHNAMHVVATGETEGYYGEFADDPWGLYARALAEGFAFQGETSPRTHEARGEPSTHQPPLAFVDFLQNHDQVGNRAMGERLITLTSQPMLDALMAIHLLSPHVPLLFMGEEYGETEPFFFFTDFHDELADAVREGRRSEFASFSMFANPEDREAIPDPNALSTFLDSKLNWPEDDDETAQAALARVRMLLQLRREHLVPHLAGAGGHAGTVLEAEPGAVAIDWRLDGASWQLRANLGAAPRGMPRATGERVFGPAPGIGGEIAPYGVVFYHDPDGGARDGAEGQTS